MKNLQTICRPLLVVGTRPEGIKMAPVIRACRDRGQVDPIVCFTGQHRELLEPIADYFGIANDFQFDVMRSSHSLSQLTANCLTNLDELIDQCRPDCVVAQGDTTSVLAASIAAFYHRIPFVHVEAGLRTDNLYSPWPEEFNRRAAGMTAAVHCAPTDSAAENLRREGAAPGSIRITGNTVVDALLWTLERERRSESAWSDKYAFLDDRECVLITGHRRENFGPKLQSVCAAIRRLAATFPEVEWVYPVHLNPNVREPVHEALSGAPNIHLTPPAGYPEFVWLMDRSRLIITDSGGVQEEAPSLGKPVLVTRDTTERPEAVEAGAVRLVGTDTKTIEQVAGQLLTDDEEYAKWRVETNPYGDGRAAERVVDAILDLSQTKVRAA